METLREGEQVSSTPAAASLSSSWIPCPACCTSDSCTCIPGLFRNQYFVTHTYFIGWYLQILQGFDGFYWDLKLLTQNMTLTRVLVSSVTERDLLSGFSLPRFRSRSSSPLSLSTSQRNVFSSAFTSATRCNYVWLMRSLGLVRRVL